MSIQSIKKRDGSLVPFDTTKIARVISLAFNNLGKNCPDLEKLTDAVVKNLEDNYKSEIPSVENISDMIEEVLMDNDYHEVMSSFVVYRDYKRKLRDLKKAIVGDSIKTALSLNAIRILESRYLLKDENGKLIENPIQLFERVAKTIVSAEEKYVGKKNVNEYYKKYFDIMNNLDFVPNSPTLMHAGTKLNILSACFVLPIEDSLDGIFKTMHNAAKIHQAGSGTGFSFSRIRPKGSFVSSINGYASGPISFIKLYNMETKIVNMGGKQRGANMAVLRVDHPDILEFITCKQTEGDIAHFNISVALTDKFMQALEVNGSYDLIDPKTKQIVSKMSAKSVFDLIVNMAWTNGEPGIIFIDEINRYNFVPNMGELESTNPCGEQPLLPYESCNLGSINLANMVKDGKIEWDKLRETVAIATRFLDNVIDVNRYPIPEIEKVTKTSRKIGLGIMGWADMLLQLKIPYNSDDAVYLAEKVMKFINDVGVETSVSLGKEKGSFPAFKDSKWEQDGYESMRNATVTTIAPTGTISMIADASSGIEPLFSIAYTKIALDEKEFVYVNKYFESEAKRRGFYSEELMYKIAREGGIQHLDEVPEDVKKLFVTTHDIGTEWHVKMQSAFQKHTHNAVSKTINMPHDSTIEDVRNAYLSAYRLGCKGLTVYREGSREIEVLKRGVKEKPKEEKPTIQKIIGKQIPKDECPICKTKMNAQEGCYTCPSCGYSKCSS